MFKKPQNLKDLTVNLVLVLFKQCSHVQIFYFFVEWILMDSSYILWNKIQDYQFRFILTNHFLVTAWPVICKVVLRPGFHKANYDYDNDQFRVKTKRLAWRMTAQPLNRFVLCRGRGVCRVMETRLNLVYWLPDNMTHSPINNNNNNSHINRRFSNTLECTVIVVQWNRKWKIASWAKWFSS